jgi:hypothetical protein
MFNIDKKNIFLVDGVGAILSTLFLISMLWLEGVFGMPKKSLYLLTPIGIAFSIYSVSCHYIQPLRWKFFLTIIAAANFLYCCLTIFMIIQNNYKLTILGRLYFIGEIAIILALIFLEGKLLSNKT